MKKIKGLDISNVELGATESTIDSLKKSYNFAQY